MLRTWRATFVEAEEQGEQCQLQPNKIYNPGNDLLRPVPDRKVCGYFLLGNSLETRRVVSRLQTAHVVVERLAQPTVVPDYRPYGDEPRQATLPRGTYWISLAQPQKHWVQATLNEDTYVPFPYFYDVSGWSLPLLAGIKGGSTGLPVTAPVVHVPTLANPTTPLPSGTLPRIAVIDQWPERWNGYQYSGWLKWRLGEDWRFPYTVLLPEQVTAKTLRKFDVVVVGNVDSDPVYEDLGADGARCPGELGLPGRSVRRLAGGRTAGVEPRDLPGGHGDPAGRVARGDDADPHPARAQRDRVGQRLQPRPPPGTARVVGAFPQRMYVSGFATESDSLAGTALETVESHGRGSVTVFGYEPNFRAVADGSARLLREAILGTPIGSVPSTTPQTASLTTARSAQRSDVLALARTRAWRLEHDV